MDFETCCTILNTVVTSLVDHVTDYVINAHTFLLHFVMACLLYALHLDGVVRGRQLATMAALEELMVYVLWLTVSHGLRSVFAIWICLSVYDAIVRPSIQLQQDPYFVADAGIEDALKSLNIKFESVEGDDGDGKRRIHCRGLRMVVFAEYSLWLRQRVQAESCLKLENVSDVQETTSNKMVVKRFQALGIELDRCLFLPMHASPNDATPSLTVALIADNKVQRNEWFAAIRHILELRISDIRYTWLLKLCSESESVNANDGKSRRSDVTDATSPSSPGGSKQKEPSRIKVGRNVLFEQALDILIRSGRQADRNYARILFKRFASVNGFLMRKLSSSGSDSKQLTWEQFLAFFSCAVTRQDINDIYDSCFDETAKPSKKMPFNTFYEFVTGTQKEAVTVDEVKQWVLQFEPVLQHLNISFVGFTNYLLDDQHSVFGRKFNQVCQDMDQPLSAYFIATSHNTYLTKDQLTSKSSVDMYINAFKRGCKCVELDVWDGANGEPVICHGYTLTSKIPVKDVIQAIKTHAFCRSPYPVILSFENHLSLEQQRVLAQFLIDILGDSLYTKPIPANERVLPSPEALKGYVIVKMKKLKPDADESVEDYFEDELFNFSSDDVVNDVIAQAEKRKQQSEIECKESCGDISTPDINEGDEITADDVISLKSEADDDEFTSYDAIEERKTKAFGLLLDTLESVRKQNKEKIKPPKIAQEFSDLVVYCQATTIRDFEQAAQNGKHYEMVSFGEKRALRQAKEDPIYWIQYNQRQLTRVYPGGSRIDSSNLDPVTMWNVGCQLVALNYQTAGIEMQLNQALFQNNGFCGYVLKPDFLRQENSSFDPRNPGDKYDILAIRVIGAHQVPYKNEKILKSERQLTVQIRIHGVDNDIQLSRTKPVKNSGLNPVWNEVLFFKIFVPELAFVNFNILVKNVFVAQYTIPYQCVQQGYRRIPMMNKYSELLPYSYLMTHISIQSP